VYKTKRIGPSTEPWGTPHRSVVTMDFNWPRRTYCERPRRYDSNQRRTGPVTPNDNCRRRHRMAWSTVSKAADKSSRTRAATSTPSTAVSRSDSTPSTALGHGADEPDFEEPQPVRFDLCTLQSMLSTVSFVVCLHCVWEDHWISKIFRKQQV